MIGIIDYGMGNLFSVSKALERLDVPYVLTDDPEQLAQCEGLILPGVGAFPDAMKSLEETGMKEFILSKVGNGKPLLGICLGMQLLFDESEEGGFTEGLGLLPGSIVRFTGKDADGNRFKVPHMGWNHLDQHQPKSPLLDSIEDGYVYFVHSYYAQAKQQEDIIASARYETEVPAVVGRANVFGAQFHPEKSGKTGMTILRNFCNLVQERGDES
ncbi:MULTISPECIES: imidazole glycerol phosphate synthase subunit HisH [Pontibacillus]|uniref:Imidazole glycerol phosphate synthase subunit HisH n=1 Tax=Pontibacillus chungwhensis TaxID=265426 RepID=A0ABY8UX26_9BACI|nr:MULTISPECIES: imidazole glycerol phosphate synthase subunit HisH [Pontibacillus]MCD5325316.1 imidazole glycerol phosphate synthase subunit HisH [Pontibacillus sp. HN14]WIF97557.1 imidazole glycerol phosphate synthase subunit HisH [Pontibacillus chungwhensis]